MTRPWDPMATWSDGLQELFGVEWEWLCKALYLGKNEGRGVGGCSRLLLRRSGSPRSPRVTSRPPAAPPPTVPGRPPAFPLVPGDCFQPPWARLGLLETGSGVTLPPVSPFSVCGVGATSIRKGPKINGPLI